MENELYLIRYDWICPLFVISALFLKWMMEAVLSLIKGAVNTF